MGQTSAFCETRVCLQSVNVVYAIDVLGGAQFTYLIEYKKSKRIKIAHARREVSFSGTV